MKEFPNSVKSVPDPLWMSFTTEIVRVYARTDQIRFGRDVNRANDLMRIVEGIIDTRAAKASRPNVFFFLGRGADG